MSMWFHRTAAAQLFRRRKGAILRMALTWMAASLWCLLGGIWAIATWRETAEMAMQTRLELFLHANQTAATVNDVARTLRQMPAVASVEIIDGRQLWSDLRRDLRLGDADLAEIVEPPTMIRVAPAREFVTVAHMELLAKTCKDAFDGVDRALWPREYVYAIERRVLDITMLGSAAGLLSLILFALAMLYALRAELHKAGEDLRVGALLGASPTFVAMPHIIVSALAGAIGVSASALALYLAWPWLTGMAPWLAAVQPTEIIAMVCTLAIAGFVICWWQSVRTASTIARNN